MAACRVVDTVAAHAGDLLVLANLVQQATQDRRVAGIKKRGADYRRQWRKLPPLPFEDHLDGAVDQQIQACLRRMGHDRHRKMFLPSADLTELSRRFAILPTAATFAAGTAMPANVPVQPDQQLTVRLHRRIVLFPVGRSIFGFDRCTHASSLPEPPISSAAVEDLCKKAAPGCNCF